MAALTFDAPTCSSFGRSSAAQPLLQIVRVQCHDRPYIDYGVAVQARVYHCAEIDEALGSAGLRQIDLWA